MNQILQEESQRYNDSPVPEFCGVSPKQMCYVTRFFSRFAIWWGLAELVEKGDIFENEKSIVRKGEILRQLFRMQKMKE
ncbi:MAG TPA: hypothetical protein PK228_21190 [Saprospiraceae bacterium]|nr:hypothetical protein [Saprospiraceae bacterium]